MLKEASDGTGANSLSFSPEQCSPTSEDRNWGRLQQALPTRADLAAVNSTLQASIRADIQVLQDDILGLNNGVGDASSPIAFIRALCPRGPHDAPPRDVVCCLEAFQTKESR
ncbi:Hypothetical predicted protein [Pelobates cultripes]|uniref:Uncharacterized protein n=1 Tax=Pelobates cultripes TaxID=61616 RepID=A0AAD1TFA5_PELCU|nr:Hypothetical predicted protein [Pelobates cultripes]